MSGIPPCPAGVTAHGCNPALRRRSHAWCARHAGLGGDRRPQDVGSGAPPAPVAESIGLLGRPQHDSRARRLRKDGHHLRLRAQRCLDRPAVCAVRTSGRIPGRSHGRGALRQAALVDCRACGARPAVRAHTADPPHDGVHDLAGHEAIATRGTPFASAIGPGSANPGPRACPQVPPTTETP